MKKPIFLTSACRFCRNYKPEGRRGGSCELLGVAVESNWAACNLAAPPFKNTFKNIEIEELLHLESALLETPISFKNSAKPALVKREVPAQARVGDITTKT